MFFAFVRKFHLNLAIAASLAASSLTFAENVEIIGGQGQTAAYAALISSSAEITSLTFSGGLEIL